ncbi:MAG: hypothetical protein NC084_09930 [Bacteroides sp.]|nr:hypothetical protein [Eubacterium sp.]MCM1419367.1 hypothetical protein [Roseburia sp.]MCM1463017.1 hypothetical protein [Bacteroides sp.]
MKKPKKLLPLVLALALAAFLSSCAPAVDEPPAEPSAEEILLEKAQQFHDLMRDYLNTDEKKLVFELGSSGYDGIYLNVISDTLTDYRSVKEIFTEALSDDYADYLLCDKFGTLKFKEENGVLYFAPSESSYIGTLDTWCVGYEETEDRIIGRFASLNGVPGHPEGEPDEAYLNDLRNYWFYNLTLEKFPEGYRITDCRVTDSEKKYPAYGEHTFYHSGAADLSKITEPALLPIDLTPDGRTESAPVSAEAAASALIDALVSSEKWREDFRLIDNGTTVSEGETYYQITVGTENEFSYSAVGRFWVSADSGAIYLRFDPTLDEGGCFSEYAENIPEDDGNTRLIPFP